MKFHPCPARVTRIVLSLLFCTPHATLAADVTMNHATLDQRLGYPAFIAPGGQLPTLTIQSADADMLESTLVNSVSQTVLQTATPVALTPNAPTAVSFSGPLPPEGNYRIDLRIYQNGEIVFQDAKHFSVLDTTALATNYSKAAHPGPGGRMRYISDIRGNRIPDFSGVGYLGGKELPQLPTVMTLTPAPGDATQRIQDAINQVSARTPDSNGFRGAVELAAGLYEIAGTLTISKSGVVLRGVGPGNRQSFMLNPSQNLTLDQWRTAVAATTATVLVATGTTYRKIITIAGSSGISLQSATSTEILDNYVPVGQRWFHVANPHYYSVGDSIQLERRGNAAWISHIKMDQIPPRGDGSPITQWTPFNLTFEHIITAIQGDRIILDSGLVCAVEQRWGGGRIQRYTEGGRIRHSGVENLRGVSFWQINENGKDNTLHPDRFISFERTRDCWARNVTAEHFTPNVGGMFSTAAGSLAITIQDCSALAGASSFYSGTGYDGSGRYWLETNTYVGRYGFLLGGQKALVRGCYTINNRHAFTFSSRTPGPNVFSNCTGSNSLTYSEPHHRWSVGGLYDNVSDGSISLMNRLNFGTGHGWAGANYVAWNTKGTLICEQPPTAQNYAIGHRSNRVNGPFHSWNLSAYGASYGYWESLGQNVEPLSLYTQQIADRETAATLQLQQGTSTTEATLPRNTVSLEVLAETGGELNPADLRYEWRSINGPGTAVFSNPENLRTSVVLDTPGTYQVELTGRSVSDSTIDARCEFTLTLHASPPEIHTTGGTVEMFETSSGRYRIHKFTDTGPHSFNVLSGTSEADVLVVGGGGGGGSSTLRWGGAGGGAGGVVETKLNLSPGTYQVQVGDGGLGGVGASGDALPGENSSFHNLIAIGGGKARGQNTPGNGGSGSGGAPISSVSETNSFAAGIALQPTSASGGFGNHGGDGTGAIGDDRSGGGGGGGGAGAPGGAAAAAIGGAGGAGRGSSITGTLSLYGGGGGGAGRSYAGPGGSGGGGSGGLNANGNPGTSNSGGGGGASSLGNPHAGGKGGSGIVVVRVPMVQIPVNLSHTSVNLRHSQSTSQRELNWTPTNGTTYVLQVSQDLIQWRNTGDVFHGDSSQSPITHTLPEFTSNREFYRLVEIK